MYQAFYNWAADDLLLDPACFPGSQDQGADIFAALATQGGTTTAACFNGLPPNLQSWAVYEAVYDSAGDDALTDPLCFAGLAPDEQQQALYAALYSIAGDDTLTDPACFLGLPPELREQAMFGAAFAVSEGQLTLDGVTNLEVTDDLNGGWSADWDDVAGADYYQIQVIGYSSTTSATSDETGSLTYGSYTIRVRPRDNDGNRGPWVSQAFTMVTEPVNTVSPAITGSTAPGSLLTVSNGTWTGGGTLTYSYQWKKNGVNVGADQNTYTTTGAVNGDTIQVVVTATNAAGNAVASSNILTVAAVPSNTVAPAVTGSTTPGSTLTTTNGTWTQSPSGYSYQWKLNGSNVGTNANTYDIPGGASDGDEIYVVVTATNSAGSANANSNTITVTEEASGVFYAGSSNDYAGSTTIYAGSTTP